MSGAKRGFAVIGSEDTPDEAATIAAATPDNTERGAQLLMLSVRALSQRALTAITNLFTAGAVLSAWWLWSTVLPNPTPLQLVGVGGYAVFLLAIEIVRRKK